MLSLENNNTNTTDEKDLLLLTSDVGAQRAGQRVLIWRRHRGSWSLLLTTSLTPN